MANEAEILNNPTSTPVAVSTGYQRQNTNAVAARVGMDATVVSGGSGQCTLEISGPVDVNGVLYPIRSQRIFTLSSADRYYIYLDGSGNYLTPTITTNAGTFDADKNARYTAGGYRILNWIIDYDGSNAVAHKWLQPNEDIDLHVYNAEIDNDLDIGNDLDVGNNLDVGNDLDVGNNLDVGNDLDVGGDISNNGFLASDLGRKPANTIHGSPTQNDIFDALAPSVPNTNDKIIVSGTIGFDPVYSVSYAERINSTTIYLYICIPGTGASNWTLTDGNMVGQVCSLAW